MTEMLASISTTLAAAAVQLPTNIAAHGPWQGGAFSPWLLLFPLFWILVIGLIIFVARRTWRRNNQWATARGGESLLRERYARGEIDETEYRQRLQVLRGDQK
jgi:putative membrane protein